MSNPLLKDAINRAASLVLGAGNAIVFTGAGISTPSGIPDFRSSRTGLWEKDDPMRVASLSAFQNQPGMFFDWLRPLARQIWMAKPNPAHLALARMQQAGRIHAVITQNIDGLHHRAGCTNVMELHGSLDALSCLNCRKTFEGRQYFRAFVEEGGLPRCPTCRELLKPAIVLFEENLPADTWNQAVKACAKADLMLVLGSSLEVYPAATLPQSILEDGKPLILINLGSTPLDRQASVHISGDVAEILPLLAERVCRPNPPDPSSTNIPAA